MQEYQIRVVNEKKELDEKCNQLERFFDTTLFKSLPEDEQGRLVRQLSHMRVYSKILAERIGNFKDDGVEEEKPAAAPEPVEHIMQFFKYAHLPPHLAEISKPFSDMAHDIVKKLPRNPERTVALRKLLESKDAAVRAFIAK